MGLDSDITTNQIEDVKSFLDSEEVTKLDGTVQLTSKKGTLLIPVPSKDPRDPLNIPLWQKWIIVLTVCIFSTLGLTAISGLGGIIVFFIPSYAAAGKTYADISDLLTYPSLFMGLGNIVSMPLALAIGRRPVFLASNVLLVVSCILCATNQSYSWHLAARCVLGLAAGQSEALCPLMVSEVHFLHERAKFLQFFSTIQTVLSGTLIILSSYITSTIGWRAWYYLFAGLSSGVAVLSFLFVPETKYDRPLIAYEGATAIRKFEQAIDPKMETHISAMTIHDERVLDTINHLSRTRLSDLEIFVTKSDWPEAGRCLKHMVQVFFFPNVMWVTVMNGVVLGINIALGLTYGNILTTYYHWEDKYVSVAQAGQLIVAFLALPMLGYGSDWIIKIMARRNKGFHEPEHRLLTLVIPLLLGVLFVVIYGQAAQYPQRYQWMAIVFTLNAYYLSFIGANTAGITYLLDSYPTRSGPVLVVICAMRGVISFCLSYGTVQLYDEVGYANAFGMFGGLTAVFFVLGVVIYFTGKRIRHFCTRWTNVEVPNRPTMG